MKYPLLFAFCFLGCLVFAQNDSTLLLSPERLTEQDIVVRDLSLQPTRVISATRSLEEADQMPFSIWVATAEDIQRNGFVTLGDVLRAAPGIRDLYLLHARLVPDDARHTEPSTGAGQRGHAPFPARRGGCGVPRGRLGRLRQGNL